MSEEKKTVELKDVELEKVSGGQRGIMFDVSAGWYKPNSSTYYYLADSYSGMDRQATVIRYYYDSGRNGLIRDGFHILVFLSSLASYTKVAAEDVPRIIQD